MSVLKNFDVKGNLTMLAVVMVALAVHEYVVVPQVAKKTAPVAPVAE